PAPEPPATNAGVPIPVAPLREDERERALFETLGGDPLKPQTPSSPLRVPAVEEVLTILAVDDDEHVLRVMERVLESRKYRVLTARSGRDALAKVREAMPDL